MNKVNNIAESTYTQIQTLVSLFLIYKKRKTEPTKSSHQALQTNIGFS